MAIFRSTRSIFQVISLLAFTIMFSPYIYCDDETDPAEAEMPDLMDLEYDDRRGLAITVLLRRTGPSEVLSTKVTNVPPWPYLSEAPDLELITVDTDSHVIKIFNVETPLVERVRQSDDTEGENNLDQAEGVFVVPLQRKLAIVQIKDQTTGGLLIEQNVQTFVEEYCNSNPDDHTNCFDESVYETDTDLDGVPDFFDNCIEVENITQADTDLDGYGNACDGDLNNDDFVNSLDLGIFKQLFMAPGSPADFNDDFIVNSLDLGMFKQMFFKPPGPSSNVPPAP